MRTRQLLAQALVVAGVAVAVLWLVTTTRANLERLGVASGIDFLWQRAGFEIAQKLVPFDANASFARAFLVAFLNTLLLAASSIAGASLIGLAVGVCRLSRNWLVARLAAAYVELFRNLPALLQIFFWYFVVLRALPPARAGLALGPGVILNNRGLFLPLAGVDAGGGWLLAAVMAAIAAVVALRRRARRLQDEQGRSTPVLLPALALLIGLPTAAIAAGLVDLHWDLPRAERFGYAGGIVLLPEFLALTVGLSIYHATYIAEIVRSAFQSVPRGQIEAADALGLPRLLTLRLVLFPQALRVALPPLGNVYLNLFKGTSLAAAIAYPEVVSVFVGTVNNLVGQPVVIMAMTLLVYSTVSLGIALALHRYERRSAAGLRS
ncbi:MAG: ABC transporter permease subunit [Gammaproteobacteria bacterium]|nr:ABC transporter permease subunit [Gammaproteobacteria bacterium]